MKYFVGQWLIATKKAVDNAPSARTLGKAYQIVSINTAGVKVESNIGAGTFKESRVDELFIVKSLELWT